MSSSGFFYRRSLTIDHTKCGTQGSPILKFPMLFSGTYSYLADMANGGKLRTGYCYDLAFFADPQLAIPCPYELLSYDNTTGAIVAYVQIPSVSPYTDAVIYLAYGNPNIYEPQYWPTPGCGCPWNEYYRAVWHMSGTTWLNDTSQSQVSTLSAPGNSPTQTTGPTGATDTAAAFAAASSQSLSLGGNGVSPFNLSSDPEVVYPGVMIEAWIYSTNFHQKMGLVAATNDSTTHWWCNFTDTSGSSATAQGSSTSESNILLPSANISNSAWHRIIASVHPSAGFIFLDGVQQDIGNATVDDTGVIASDGSYDVEVGLSFGSYGYFDGKMSEVRVSNVVQGVTSGAQSDTWCAADYNSNNSPSTFYTMGSEVVIAEDISGMIVSERANL